MIGSSTPVPFFVLTFDSHSLTHILAITKYTTSPASPADKELAATTAMAAPQLVTVNAFQLQQQLQLQHQQQQQQQTQNQAARPVIERGASWSYNETRILLSLWGQDMVQRQLTNSKRTRHVWEKIAERIREHGFERTAGELPPKHVFLLI